MTTQILLLLLHNLFPWAFGQGEMGWAFWGQIIL
jgi:hypothetical protein